MVEHRGGDSVMGDRYPKPADPLFLVSMCRQLVSYTFMRVT